MTFQQDRQLLTLLQILSHTTRQLLSLAHHLLPIARMIYQPTQIIPLETFIQLTPPLTPANISK